eukprot:TRINITY_DN2849_c0_g1_i5.p1 TRINITY_DN2849_c0_g1~~TRINITY_DN2849_c0_g1_i5.p1  ORF type:complete len:186 (+),score=-20.22 TRINITY_DN2849_c0_g1_i5:876-1433(+)
MRSKQCFVHFLQNFFRLRRFHIIFGLTSKFCYIAKKNFNNKHMPIKLKRFLKLYLLLMLSFTINQILHVLIRINNYIFIKQNNHTNILYNTFIQNNYHNIFFFNYCDDLGNKNFISLFDLNKFVNKNQPYRILIKIIISWIQKHNVCNFRLTMKRRQKFMCYIFCGLFILINDYEINSFIFARYT